MSFFKTFRIFRKLFRISGLSKKKSGKKKTSASGSNTPTLTTEAAANAGEQVVAPAPYNPVTKIGNIGKYQTPVNNYTFAARNGKKLKVYYSVPVNVMPGAQVLFVMHGVNRDADKYAEYFRYLAETENIIVITPEFAKNQFSSAQYQRIDIEDNIKKPEKWTTKIIDDIFMDFTGRFNFQNDKYIMYGHSAGSQFTHRALMFSESSYLDYGIAANAGTYTFPDEQVDYHFGIKNLFPIHRDLINRNFARRLYVLTGNRDNDPNADNLTRSAEADRQGIHRHERALRFYKACKDYCTSNNIAFNWELIVMDGVAHKQVATRPYVIDIITGKYNK